MQWNRDKWIKICWNQFRKVSLQFPAYKVWIMNAQVDQSAYKVQQMLNVMVKKCQIVHR